DLEEPAICAGCTRHRSVVLGHSVPACAAQCAGARAGAGHRSSRHSDHHRSHSLLPGGGCTAYFTLAWYHHPCRQRFSFLRRVVDHHLPRPSPRLACPFSQPAWALAARRPEPPTQLIWPIHRLFWKSATCASSSTPAVAF